MRGGWYSIRGTLGRYGKWYLVLYGRKKFYRHIRIIERFLSCYPDKKRLSQFSREDLHDWTIERGRKVSPLTLKYELWSINKFWQWVEENSGYTLRNLALEFARRQERKVPRCKNKKTLSLLELRVILSKLEPPSLQSFIAARIVGVEVPPYTNPSILNVAFRRAAEASGLDYKLVDLNRSMPQLRLAILQDLSAQVRDTLTLESKLDSGALGDIELAGVDTMLLQKGATVCHDHKDALTVLGISEKQLSPEG